MRRRKKKEGKDVWERLNKKDQERKKEGERKSWENCVLSTFPTVQFRFSIRIQTPWPFYRTVDQTHIIFIIRTTRGVLFFF